MSFPWNIRPFIKSYERLWSARRTRRKPTWSLENAWVQFCEKGTKTSINQSWSITQGKQKAGIHPWKAYVKSENTIRKEKYQAKNHPIFWVWRMWSRISYGWSPPHGFFGDSSETAAGQGSSTSNMQGWQGGWWWWWMEVNGAPATPGPLLLAMMRDSKFMGKQHGHTLETHSFFVVYRCMSLQWEGQFVPEFCWIAWLLLFLWIKFMSDSDADEMLFLCPLLQGQNSMAQFQRR